MLDPAQTAALTAILRLGSFEAAARALGVTQSAVSQRIRALEEHLGTALVIRGQPALATDAGARVARHAEDVALMEAALRADMGLGAAERPVIRVAINADSLATWAIPALARVDGVLFDVVIDDQDHSEALLRTGAVMAAVTSRHRPLQGCDAYPLGRLRFVATAAPDFTARWFAGGVTAAALAAAPALRFNRKDRLQADWAALAAGRPVDLPTHQIASSHDFVRAALLGLGWCLNPEPLVQDDLAAGRLVALRPDLPLDVGLTWQVARATAGPLQPLTRAVRTTARGVLLP
jgi:LysR family transcriptional regulator (chromosome initiation inhibitor)